MIFLLHETNKHKIQKIELLGTFKVYLMLFRNKVFLYFTFATGMQTAMFFSMNGFMPYEYLRLGVSLTEFGIWFSLTSFGYIVGNIVNSKVASKGGLEKMCFYGTKLSLIVIDTKTSLEGFLLNLLANTDPADPPPIIIKSTTSIYMIILFFLFKFI